ncbi:SDR family oxidoreductase [bacterium]|nr:SDR family oxidoreductase [bacterium]
MTKKILITGATKGIGRKIFEEMLSVGEVFVIARNRELLEELKILGAKDVLHCDLSSDIKFADSFIVNNQINVLINNAGIYNYSALSEENTDTIDDIIKTNIKAPICLSKFVLPEMKKNKWGRIINIGSISGVMGEAYASVYSASKASLIGFSKALALETAEYNITVNTINPGWVDTELGNNSINESEFSKDEIIETIPQKRFVDPVEIAKLVKYLISDDARGITGQSINICAGLSVGY